MKLLMSFACLLFLSSSLLGQIAKGDDGLFYDENGDLFTGVYKETYPSGGMKAEMTLWNGQKHGV